MALGGAYLASRGYDPASDPGTAATPVRGFVPFVGFMVAVAVPMTLLIPVVARVNDGRWDLRKAKTEATLFAIAWATVLALLLAGAGAYRLAAWVFGGWSGDWRAVAMGALIGAALGTFARLVLDGFRLAERLGVPNRNAEPGAVPAPLE